MWEMTNQEKTHAFATMKMKISNLLVKSISLFRDKSKCESLLSVINSLQGSLLAVSGPLRGGLGSLGTWLQSLADPQTHLALSLISLPTLLGDLGRRRGFTERLHGGSVCVHVHTCLRLSH